MGKVKRILFILFFLFLFSSLTKNAFEYRKNYSFYDSYKTEADQVKKRNTQLKTQLLKQSDPYEIEKTIRNKLSLLKPNEIAIILPQPSPTPRVFIPTPAPVYRQWWDTFFAR